MEDVELSFDPFSYQRRATERIFVAAVSDRRTQSDGAQTAPLQQIGVGGEELMRVVVWQANYDKIAHKIDKMGDYKPEIVYENARIIEVDPRDDAEISKINSEPAPQLVTVQDDVDLPLITAFRLLAARLQSRHPILLKDELVGAVYRTARKRQSGSDRLGAIAPNSDFLQTLLI